MSCNDKVKFQLLAKKRERESKYKGDQKQLNQRERIKTGEKDKSDKTFFAVVRGSIAVQLDWIQLPDHDEVIIKFTSLVEIKQVK